MPAKSPAQERLMQAAAHTPGGYGGVPQKVGKEFIGKDAKLPTAIHSALADAKHEPKSEEQKRAMYSAAEGESKLGIPKKVGEEFVGKQDSAFNESDHPRAENGQFGSGASTSKKSSNPAFEKAKEKRNSIESRMKSASSRMEELKNAHGGESKMGLTPDVVKNSPEWKQAHSDFNNALRELQTFNTGFTKTFKKELAEERKLKYSNPRADSSMPVPHHRAFMDACKKAVADGVKPSGDWVKEMNSLAKRAGYRDARHAYNDLREQID